MVDEKIIRKIKIVPQVVLASLLLCVGAVILYIEMLLNEKDLLIPACMLIFLSGIFYSRKLPRWVLVLGILLLCVVGILSFLWVAGEHHYPRIWADAGEDQTVKINETVEFNATNSVVGYYGCGPNMTILEKCLFLWDFDAGDGIQVDAIGLRVNHTYTTTGVYEVTLILVALPRYPCESISGMDIDTLTITVIEE